MRNQSIEVTINGKPQTIQPQDIVSKSGEEFLIFLDKEDTRKELRADQIILTL
jgi:hypothetical protein